MNYKIEESNKILRQLQKDLNIELIEIRGRENEKRA